MAQSARHPTLDLHTGLDLRVRSSSPALGSSLGVEPTLKKKIKNKKKKNHSKYVLWRDAL